MKFNVIGAGRLGKNIAFALSSSHIASLQAVYNRSFISAEQSCKDIGTGIAVNKLEDLPEANIIWLTCNDDSIKLIVAAMVERSLLKPGTIVIHCSGVLDSTLLQPLKSQGCLIASFHPLKAFRAGHVNANSFHGVDCVLEGDEEACAWVTKSFTPLGANIIGIKPEAKVAYHTAASIASAYLITLASCSEQLLLKAGISQEQARSLICNLMQSNIDNLRETEQIAQSLTGALGRGDHETLSLHLTVIENPVMKQLYKIAGLATLPLTQLPVEKTQIISKLLENN